jgi:ectoine hydroxylase-related dioxygenase (phytanoyl-CoA dioxygenase family)
VARVKLLDQETFNQRGFLIIPRVIGELDIARVEEALANPSSAGVRSKAGLRHAFRHRAVQTVARDARLLDIAQSILGSGAIPFGATLFDKSPRSNWLVAWHQDTALPFREKRDMPGWGPWSVKDGIHYAHAPARTLAQILALRVHLDDSTVDNGPLRVLPGSHNMGVLSRDQIHDQIRKVASVDCQVPKGGILAMSPLSVHASSKSRSTVNRRVLHIQYAATPLVADGLKLAMV